MVQYAACAQATERVVVLSGRGSGAAPNSKNHIKVIRLVDTDTKEPVTGYMFTYLAQGNILYTSKTNAEGYGRLIFNMSNYYKKIEINLNDGKYIKPEWKDHYDERMKNDVPYKPVNKIIKFPSRIDKVDTVTVMIKKL